MTEEEVDPVDRLFDRHDANRPLTMAAFHAGMPYSRTFVSMSKAPKRRLRITKEVRDYRSLQSLVFSDLLEQTI